jgi:hypothetical protein
MGKIKPVLIRDLITSVPAKVNLRNFPTPWQIKICLTLA